MVRLEVIHKLHELACLPWNHLDPERIGRDWSIGRGGYGFDNQTWTLSIIHKDGSADVWELPPALGAVFGMLKDCEARKVRDEIRRALGV
jgi:hypothetical protein